jgi:hypothetical protein
MSELNSDTGLPALPDGMFWRVMQERHYYGGLTNAVVVQIIQPYTETTRPPRTFFGIQFGTYPEKEVRKENILGEEIITGEDKEKYILYSKITADDVYRTAELVLAAYNKSQSAKDLLGDYPPNKLNRG